MKTFLYLFILFLSINLFAEVKRFEIKWGDDRVGLVTAERHMSNLGETIEIKSKAEFSILFMMQKMIVNMRSFFRGEDLEESKTESQFNDNDPDITTIKKSTDDYLLANEGDLSRLKSTIQFTVSKLYFYEPHNIKRIYSERHLDFCSLTKISDHTYKLDLPNGSTNFYTYKNNNLVKMTSKRHGVKLSFNVLKS